MYWKPYVSVSQRQANAKKKMDKLRKQGNLLLIIAIVFQEGVHMSEMEVYAILA